MIPIGTQTAAHSGDSLALRESYAHCARVARTQARNFYYSFVVLPPQKRASMCAVYAFMRYCDDLSDDAGLTDRATALEQWRTALARAYEGDCSASPILPAFHDTVRRYNIPRKLFDDLIDGVEMDLTRTRYATFEDLYGYCYRVAATVGLVCIHVWGYSGEEAFAPAESCGIAFQLTNILRDLKEDAERGRIYLPQEDLARFGVQEDDLLHGTMRGPFVELMRFEVDRARDYYEKARALGPMLSDEGRETLEIMCRIYRGLLDRIEASGYDVFSRRVGLSASHKVRIVASTWLTAHLRAVLRPGSGNG